MLFFPVQVCFLGAFPFISLMQMYVKCHKMLAYLGAVFALSAMKCPPTWVLCLP